ncbi:MAG: 6-phosphofructokinase [Ruminococcaceae bacterium]|nr:6-phosphofructokinase [Oscillospiraceae bacterium]
MAKEFKRIGILTSGGDAPGMNAAVRAVTRYALKQGLEVYGIYEGYKGLIEGKGSIKKFSPRDVANIIEKGGTALYSARCVEFKEEAGLQRAIEVCREFQIDGIIAIGGDGTFRGASDLCKRGIPCIGIPATIDNDITCTDRSIGFDTAMNTVVEAIDRLRDTCESHARCNVVEVMGRNAGYIALETSIAVGATGVVVKEDLNYQEDALIEKIRVARAAGKRNFIVVVAEGVDHYSEGLAKRIEAETGVETKFARLAHIVRGGSPSLADRLLAAQMGVAAVDALLAGKQNVFICQRDGDMVATDIQEAIATDKMYKNSFDSSVKYPEEALKAYSAERIAEMKEFCAMRTKEVQALLTISENISNYQ